LELPLAEDPAVISIIETMRRHQEDDVIWVARCCSRLSINVRQAPKTCGECGKPVVDMVEFRASTESELR
jgi:hypothetical protein